MNKKIKNELTDKLFECILSMETVEECYQLFEDLCTINEIQAIAQRMEVAAMLDAKRTYVEIAEKTGASFTVMKNGEHWFHTAEQMKFLDNWIKENINCINNQKI